MAHPRERRLRSSGITRRQFLRRSAGAAIAFPSAAAILAACGHASNPDNPSVAAPSGSPSAFPLARVDHPVTWPLYDDNPAIESNQEPETNATLKIYNWEDYLWPKLCKKFGNEMGCK